MPGRAIICRDALGLRFDRRASDLGYPTTALDTGHDAMLTAPAALSDLLLELA